MSTPHAHRLRVPALLRGHIPSLRKPSWWLGIALIGCITLAALHAADTTWARHLGVSALTLAIVLGMAIGNTVFGKIAPYTASGVDYAKHSLLRLAIVLYGFRVLFSDIAQVGISGVLLAVCVLSLTFALAVQLGTHLLGMDKHTAMLIGAGSSICGAAAVLSTQPVLKADEYKVSVAVATVVVFGTVSMVLYPLIYPYLGVSAHIYGLYTGATVHEVAQVVVAGKGVSDAAAATAVIEKMLRVMMLAPFLMWLSWNEAKTARLNHETSHTRTSLTNNLRNITIPWFALGFIAANALHSLRVLPAALVQWLVALDTVLLTMAMAALGLRTHFSCVRKAGVKPIVLAAMLFAFLLVGGYLMTIAITTLRL